MSAIGTHLSGPEGGQPMPPAPPAGGPQEELGADNERLECLEPSLLRGRGAMGLTGRGNIKQESVGWRKNPKLQETQGMNGNLCPSPPPRNSYQVASRLRGGLSAC